MRVRVQVVSGLGIFVSLEVRVFRRVPPMLERCYYLVASVLVSGAAVVRSKCRVAVLRGQQVVHCVLVPRMTGKVVEW